MSPESEKPDSRGTCQALEVICAAVGLALTGPALTVILPTIVMRLLLCACSVVIVVASPYVIISEAPRLAAGIPGAVAVDVRQATNRDI